MSSKRTNGSKPGATGQRYAHSGLMHARVVARWNGLSKKRHADYRTASLSGRNSHDFRWYEVGSFGAPREDSDIVVAWNESLDGEAEPGVLEPFTVNTRDIRP